MLALLPHGICYVWDPRLIWLHALADGLIALAYFSIPAVIGYILRKRSNFPFRGTLVWFATFILVCGLTHVLEVISIWQPIYWPSGFTKAVTAVISAIVAVQLWCMRETFLKAPSTESYLRLTNELDQLVQERTAELSAANERLREEVAQRRSAEAESVRLDRTLANRVSEMRTLIDLLPVGIAIKTRDTSIALEYNATFADQFGLPKRGQVSPPPDPQSLLAQARCFVEQRELAYEELPLVRGARQGVAVQNLELRVLIPGGPERTLLVSVAPIIDDNGQVRGSVGTYQDITRLHQEETDLRLVIEAAPNAMIIADREGRILLANTEAHQLFGYPSQSLTGCAVDSLLPEALRDAHRRQRDAFTNNPDRRAMGGGRDLFGRRHDGSEFPLEIGLNPIRLSSGPAVLASIVDLSDRKRAEAERLQFERSLHETQKLESLGVMAGGIAHDFNNILTSILGHSSMLRHDLGSVPPEAIDALDHIETSSERAADLCRQLMAYAGRGKFEQKSIDLSRMVTETGKLLEVTVSKLAQVQYQLGQNLPSVVGDPTQLRQVLMNLVINAAEAAEPKSGRIVITTSTVQATESYIEFLNLSHDLKPGLYVTLEVQDNGKGMDEATQSRIFDPFFTTKFTGRGLGLAAVLGIVRNHGGGIRVYSEVGHGTQFKILLPSTGESAAPPAPERKVLPSTKFTGNVLVIDDEVGVRNLLTSALTRFGLTVETVESGPKGLALLQAKPQFFNLVMLDLTMPEMDGDVVMELIARHDPDLPVVMMSGFNEQDTIQRIHSRKPRAFLGKPFSLELILEKLRPILAPGSR